jgi:hypothetical protein
MSHVEALNRNFSLAKKDELVITLCTLRGQYFREFPDAKEQAIIQIISQTNTSSSSQLERDNEL